MFWAQQHVQCSAHLGRQGDGPAGLQLLLLLAEGAAVLAAQSEGLLALETGAVLGLGGHGAGAY